jgi:hypothetical protein
VRRRVRRRCGEGAVAVVDEHADRARPESDAGDVDARVAAKLSEPDQLAVRSRGECRSRASPRETAGGSARRCRRDPARRRSARRRSCRRRPPMSRGRPSGRRQGVPASRWPSPRARTPARPSSGRRRRRCGRRR